MNRGWDEALQSCSKHFGYQLGQAVYQGDGAEISDIRWCFFLRYEHNVCYIDAVKVAAQFIFSVGL